MRAALENIIKNLEDLGEIGFVLGKGVTRLAYSDKYKEAVRYVRSLMEEAGLETRIDAVGNLIGKLQGKSDKSIIIGSHIDSVPEGGIFDGCLGVISGIECVREIKKEGYINNHTIEVIAFAEEEGNVVGGTFGSKCFAGEHINETYIEKFHKVGLSLQDVYASKRDKKDIKNYIELHIEQGGILDSEKTDIGVVEGIVGIIRYHCIVNGVANHAGTTPMHLRKDALLMAMNVISRLNAMVRKTDSKMVATVGQADVRPGAVNVVPGKVEFVIELRDRKMDDMNDIMEHIIDEFKEGDITFERILYEPQVHMDPEVVQIIADAAEKSGYKYKRMFSGAGHDAVPLSRITRAGMIFVPSIGGISHSIYERTKWDDVLKGLNVLIETVKELDKKEG